jgi:predicted MFS family arabinose efflux permease
MAVQGTETTSIGAARRDAAWPAIFALALGVFGLVTAEFLPPALLTPMSRDLGVSTGVAGQSVTVTALVATLAGPAVVMGTSRFDRRVALLGLTLCLVVSSVAAAMAHSVAVLFAARFLLGVGLGGFWSMSVALAMRLAPPEAMGRAMALIMTGVSLATICATPVGAWIGDTMGWRHAFFMSAGLGVLALVTQAATVPPLPSAGSTGLSSFHEVLRRPSIKRYLGATFFIVSGHFAAFTYVRPFLEEVSGFTSGTLSVVFFMFGIAGFFGNLLGGAAAQRSARLAIVTAALGIAATMLALVVAGSTQWLTTAALAVWGLAFGSYPVSAQTFLAKVAPDKPESASALQTATFTTAISLGAIVGGVLVNRLGPISVVVFAGAAAAVGALLVRGIVSSPATDGGR